MAYTLQQRDVLRDALQAVSRLFEHSARNAWLGMRKDYGELYHRLEDADRDCAKLESERDHASQRAKRRCVPGGGSADLRSSTGSMDGVGEGPGTMGEIVERVWSAHDDFDVYKPYLEPIVKEMVRLGNLEKVSTGGCANRGSRGGLMLVGRSSAGVPLSLIYMLTRELRDSRSSRVLAIRDHG